MTTRNADGCTYGRGTRWGVSTVLAVVVVVFGWAMMSAWANRTEAADRLENVGSRVRAVEVTGGRTDERLKGLKIQLDRIESAVGKL